MAVQIISSGGYLSRGGWVGETSGGTKVCVIGDANDSIAAYVDIDGTPSKIGSSQTDDSIFGTTIAMVNFGFTAVLDSSDVLHIICHGPYNDNTRDLAYNTITGLDTTPSWGTWANATDIADDFFVTFGVGVRATVDGSDDVKVAFLQHDKTKGTAYAFPAFIEQVSGSWQSAVTVSDETGTNSNSPNILFSDLGVAVIYWNENTTPSKDNDSGGWGTDTHGTSGDGDAGLRAIRNTGAAAQWVASVDASGNLMYGTDVNSLSDSTYNAHDPGNVEKNILSFDLREFDGGDLYIFYVEATSQDLKLISYNGSSFTEHGTLQTGTSIEYVAASNQERNQNNTTGIDYLYNDGGAIYYDEYVAGATYTLTAAQGSFSLTGQASNLLLGRYLSAAQGSFALTGNASNLLLGRYLSAAQGSFALTGNAAGLRYDRFLTAAQGSFSLTGNDAGLTWSGGGATYTLTAAQGSFTLTGQASNLLLGRYLSAAQGSFALTGNDTGLRYDRVLVAGQGAFALTGNDAGLLLGRALVAGQGSFALTGNDTGLRYDRILVAAQGSFALTGNDANLVYTQVGAYTLVAGQGSFALTGQDTGLRFNRILVAGQGSFALTGQDTDFRLGRVLVANQGAFSLTGPDTGLRYNRILTAGQGSFSLTGNDSGLLYGRVLVADQGAFSLTGTAVGFSFSGSDYKLLAEQGAFTLNGYDVVLDWDLLLSTVSIDADYKFYVVGRDGLKYQVVISDNLKYNIRLDAEVF